MQVIDGTGLARERVLINHNLSGVSAAADAYHA